MIYSRIVYFPRLLLNIPVHTARVYQENSVSVLIAHRFDNVLKPHSIAADTGMWFNKLAFFKNSSVNTVVPSRIQCPYRKSDDRPRKWIAVLGAGSGPQEIKTIQPKSRPSTRFPKMYVIRAISHHFLCASPVSTRRFCVGGISSCCQAPGESRGQRNPNEGARKAAEGDGGECRSTIWIE